MRRLCLLALIPLAACAPPAPRTIAPTYTPPPRAAAPAPASTSIVYQGTELEQRYRIDYFLALEGYRCKILTSAQSRALGVAVLTDPKYTQAIDIGRRKFIEQESLALAIDGRQSPCTRGTTTLVPALQRRYGLPVTTASGPAPRRPSPSPAPVTGDGKTSPADTGWQPGATPRPPPKPDQVDL